MFDKQFGLVNLDFSDKNSNAKEIDIDFRSFKTGQSDINLRKIKGRVLRLLNAFGDKKIIEHERNGLSKAIGL